ncbi:MAG: SDR family oxidoreductase [Syntrophales bacterium]|jgi:2-deoxy-D-gluconate 3-dehydrogenase|nr:SDR family oxidoreductase [Syntrophales bacterium]
MGNISYGLKDKVAVVTGGSRGIGRELAGELLAQGARVAICGRKQEGLDAAASSLGGGDRLIAVATHVAREADVDHLFDQTVKAFGRIDILINNVGMNLITASIADTDPPLWNKILESNLTGTYLCSRKAARLMRERKCGKIVNISSIAGRRASPGMGVYGIAKAGIEMLTKIMAMELAAANIQVNAVAPGLVRTEFSRPFWSNEGLCKMIVKDIPAGRIAEAGDVVHPALFLCSAQADYITGQTILVDGGSSVV